MITANGLLHSATRTDSERMNKMIAQALCEIGRWDLKPLLFSLAISTDTESRLASRVMYPHLADTIPVGVPIEDIAIAERVMWVIMKQDGLKYCCTACEANFALYGISHTEADADRLV